MSTIRKIFLAGLLTLCFTSSAIYAQVSVSVGISVHTAPPPLPVYTQPPCPADGYLWTPGYWAYGPDGYYWVPGVWVRPPAVGLLWTPAYWGFAGGVYGFHPGYWGPHVGFYGGIDYGFGYSGSGYGGGRWDSGRFRYNTAVTNVNTTVIHNTYVNNTVINNNRVSNRYSFNGPGGATARPNRQELSAMNERHQQATTAQMNHQQTMSRNRNQLATVNHGKPASVNTNNSYRHTAANFNNGAAAHASNRPMQNTRVEPAHRQMAMHQNMRPAYQNRPSGVRGGGGNHGGGHPQGRSEGHRRG